MFLALVSELMVLFQEAVKTLGGGLAGRSRRQGGGSLVPYSGLIFIASGSTMV